LFTGDVYYKSDKLDKAGEWFARAISIDPDRETAYRYWGDVLTKQGKMMEARDKFVKAFIAAPYNRLARAGLIKWADKNQVSLAHPKAAVNYVRHTLNRELI
jgi:tetratricopeptide (TPR) repeat protein